MSLRASSRYANGVRYGYFFDHSGTLYYRIDIVWLRLGTLRLIRQLRNLLVILIFANRDFSLVHNLTLLNREMFHTAQKMGSVICLY